MLRMDKQLQNAAGVPLIRAEHVSRDYSAGETTVHAPRDCVFAIRGGRAVRIPVDVIYRAGEIAVISGEEASGGIAAGETVAADADAEGLSDGAKIKVKK